MCDNYIDSRISFDDIDAPEGTISVISPKGILLLELKWPKMIETGFQALTEARKFCKQHKPDCNCLSCNIDTGDSPNCGGKCSGCRFEHDCMTGFL